MSLNRPLGPTWTVGGEAHLRWPKVENRASGAFRRFLAGGGGLSAIHGLGERSALVLFADIEKGALGQTFMIGGTAISTALLPDGKLVLGVGASGNRIVIQDPTDPDFASIKGFGVGGSLKVTTNLGLPRLELNLQVSPGISLGDAAPPNGTKAFVMPLSGGGQFLLIERPDSRWFAFASVSTLSFPGNSEVAFSGRFPWISPVPGNATGLLGIRLDE